MLNGVAQFLLQGDDDAVHRCVVDIDQSPSKRRKVGAVETVSNNFDVSLYSEALKGGVEVIYCERFNGDSASQLTRLRAWLDEGKPELMKAGIRAVAEMSEKVVGGETVLLKNKDNYEGRIYTKLCIVRLVDETSKRKRMDALVKLAKFMNGEIAGLVRSRELKPNQPKWRVRKSFDRTPSDPERFRKLDDVVSPTFAVRLVAEAYTGVGPSWGLENPALADLFFTPPHSKVVREALFSNKRN